jgi:hypothetical protein
MATAVNLTRMGEYYVNGGGWDEDRDGRSRASCGRRDDRDQREMIS